jgi:hypothetical protein
MLLWCIKWVTVSLLLIVLVHYLYSFFKSTLTIPKIKDLVNKPAERYNEIYTTIQNGKSSVSAASVQKVAANDASDMQSELKQFLQHLHTGDTIESHSLGSNNNNAFASYS